ncbi:MAG: hypothetical protein JXK07_15965 [Spirochaetes bacterium]|nr:hypothetical protein [Spirochaetota bacterium]MBN2770571.1 hypothetical protein [Spirochaetota bacterium]
MKSIVKRCSAFFASWSIFILFPAFIFILLSNCSKKEFAAVEKRPAYRVHFAQRVKDNIYIATYNQGLFVKSVDADNETQLLNSEFKRRTMLDGVDEFRKVTAFAVNSTNPDNIAVAVKHLFYETTDGGKTWEKCNGDLDPYNYITALCFDSSGTLYAGTSFNGVYKREGDQYIRFSRGLSLEPYSAGLVFYDPVARIREVGGRLYLSQYFNKGVYFLKKTEWIKTDFDTLDKTPDNYIADFERPLVEDDSVVNNLPIVFSENSRKKNMEMSGFDNDHVKKESYFGGVLYHADDGFSLFVPDPELPVRSSLKDEAKGKKSLYTSTHYAVKGVDRLISIIKKSGLNALVIDVKDDYGDIYIPVAGEDVFKAGSIKTSIDLKPVLEKLKKENIYAIARIVVFKDKRLFEAYDNRYTILDKATGKPWRYGRERWVDPFSQFVRDYNINVALAAQNFGFDEVQFDYIRFPADGPVERCVYTFARYKDAFKSEAMEDFLQQASSKITVPVSTDIYGITASYNFGNRIGQDIEVYARHMDAVSSMVYPSHYGPRYMMQGSREERPYRIVYDSGVRSLFLSRVKVYMRPYLQAFIMASPTFGTGYIQNQVQGVYDSGCDGYIFWHAGGKYDVVRRALSE